jgi:hypothetical protein
MGKRLVDLVKDIGILSELHGNALTNNIFTPFWVRLGHDFLKSFIFRINNDVCVWISTPWLLTKPMK